MCREYVLSQPDPEFEELSAVFGVVPGYLPFDFHRLADGSLCGCHEDLRDSGLGGGSWITREFGSWLAASLAAWSAASLPSTPICAGIHRNCTSHSQLRSLSRVCAASTRIYWTERCLGFCIAWMAAWLSVKIVHLLGMPVVACMSSIICSARTSPLSSAAYTVEVEEVPIYSVRFLLMSLVWSVDATAAAPMWPLMPLPSVQLYVVFAFQNARESIKRALLVASPAGPPWRAIIAVRCGHVVVERASPDAHRGLKCCLVELLLHWEQVRFYVHCCSSSGPESSSDGLGCSSLDFLNGVDH